MTQEQFADTLLMSPRSNISLEHGKNLCCTLTFIIYLVFICDDVDSLVSDLKKVLIEAAKNKSSSA